MPFLPISVALGLALACLFRLALGLPRGARLAVLVVLDGAILLAPLVIPPGDRLARFLGAVLAVVLAVKLFDLHLGAIRDRRPDFPTMFAFLVNLTSVVERRLAAEPRHSRAEDLRRLGAMLAATAPGIVACWWAWHTGWRGLPFAAEYAFKTAAFFLVVFPGGAAGAALWRLLGQPAREPMADPLAADSPADFWRRYNRIGGQFFHEDVFKPLKGIRRPIRGTLATFAVSGLLHEYLFVIAAGRVQGYQMAFFLLQGVAVVATLRVRPRGPAKILGIAATLAFNLATARLFFASFDEIWPFYERR